MNRCETCGQIYAVELPRCPFCAPPRQVVASAPPATESAAVTLKGLVGVVYLLQAGSFFKIGRSTHPNERYDRLSIQLPEPVELLHEIETNDVAKLERHWHLHFRERRKNGEWFALSSQDVDEFVSHQLVWFKWR